MFSRTAKISIVVILLLLMAFVSAEAAEFSADMTIKSAAAGMEMNGKVFVRGNALRQELDTPAGKQVTIVSEGANVMYVILPGQKMYMEMPKTQVTLDEKEDMETKFSQEGTLSKQGSETIEGYECDIFQIVYNDPGLGQSLVWVSRKLNYPLKMEMENPQDKATILYTNIAEGTLEDSLFVLPSGYQKLSM